MFGLGAGETAPALHNPDYDFPDGLIGSGGAMFRRIITQLLVAKPAIEALLPPDTTLISPLRDLIGQPQRQTTSSAEDQVDAPTRSLPGAC